MENCKICGKKIQKSLVWENNKWTLKKQCYNLKCKNYQKK